MSSQTRKPQGAPGSTGGQFTGRTWVLSGSGLAPVKIEIFCPSCDWEGPDSYEAATGGCPDCGFDELQPL